MGEPEDRVVGPVRRDLLLEDPTLDLVRQQHHDHVGPAAGGAEVEDLEAGLPGGGGAPASLAGPDDHGDSAIAEVHRVRVALVAETEDGHGQALQTLRTGVFFRKPLWARGIHAEQDRTRAAGPPPSARRRFDNPPGRP